MFGTTLLALSLAGPLAAACLDDIRSPAANPGMEAVKTLLQEGKLADAMQNFEISQDSKDRLIVSIAPILREQPVRCVTLRRSAQSPHFMSEIIMYENNRQGFVYLILSGETPGDQFRMINFRFSGDYAEIRALLF